MVVAAAKIVLDFWGNEDLKDKRKLIEVLSDKLSAEFEMKLTEVDAFQDLERCVLGLSFCISEREKARVKMEKVLKFIDENSAARVVAADSDMLTFD